MRQDNRLLPLHCWLGSNSTPHPPSRPSPGCFLWERPLTRFDPFFRPSGHTEAFVQTTGPVCSTASHLLSEGSRWGGFNKSTPAPAPPPRPSPQFPSQCQRDIPSWDTGRLSCLYNTLFYPDPSFEMLRGPQQEEASRLRSKASLTHIRAGVCVSLGLCIKLLLAIIPSIDLCLIPLAAC